MILGESTDAKDEDAANTEISEVFNDDNESESFQPPIFEKVKPKSVSNPAPPTEPAEDYQDNEKKDPKNISEEREFKSLPPNIPTAYEDQGNVAVKPDFEDDIPAYHPRPFYQKQSSYEFQPHTEHPPLPPPRHIFV